MNENTQVETAQICQANNNSSEHQEVILHNNKIWQSKATPIEWRKEVNKGNWKKDIVYFGARKSEDRIWVHDQVYPARQMKPFCNCKMSSKPLTLKCWIFSRQREIFNYFWQILESWDARKHYVGPMTDKIKRWK